MTAELTGTPQDVSTTGAVGTSYTAESGSNRAVVWIVGFEEVLSRTLAPTMGAQAFTEGVFIEGSDRSYAGVYFILEADIPSGAQTLDLNESNAIDEDEGSIFTLTGVNQSSVGNGFSLDSPSSNAPVLNITGVTDGFASALFIHEASSGDMVADPAWITIRNNVGSASRYTMSRKATTSGADTYEPTITGINRQGVLVSFVFNPSGGAPSGNPYYYYAQQ